MSSIAEQEPVAIIRVPVTHIAQSTAYSIPLQNSMTFYGKAQITDMGRWFASITNNKYILRLVAVGAKYSAPDLSSAKPALLFLFIIPLKSTSFPTEPPNFYVYLRSYLVL